MTWCVCLDNDGSMVVMSRSAREILLKWCSIVGIIPESYVVKTFESREEAEKYIEDIKSVNDIIDGL